MDKKSWKMCGSKVQIKDHAFAKRRANELGLRCYHCPNCNKYHLTSDGKNNERHP